jgi:hypothetical protein
MSFNSIKFGTPQKAAPQTCAQDCSLIANTFDKACHYATTEESVFAPIYRQLETSKNFSSAAQQGLQGYLVSPTSKAVSDLTTSTQEVVNIGTSEVPGGSVTSIGIGNSTKEYMSDLLSSDTMDWLADCIPCGDRILSLLELHPSLDFLGTLRADVTSRLKMLTDIINLLQNFDIYADYCKFFNVLGEMCVPDLQRLIVMFTALIMDEVPKFDANADMLRSLIGPIFMPILTMITSLLDQFALVILSPVDCMIDHIGAQIQKLYLQMDPKNPLQEMSNGLAELNKAITQGKEKIQEKLEFYIVQVKKLLEEEMTTSQHYLKVSLRKLNYIRLIVFIVAIILALSRGQLACLKDGKSPKEQEIDDFFSNFLNPNVPYSFRLDPDGNMVIDEQILGYDDVYNSPTIDPQGTQTNIDPELLGSLPTSTAEKVVELEAALTSPVEIKVPCKLKTNPGESAKIDMWIRELTQEG